MDYGPGISAVRSLPALAIGSCCFYTLHYVSLCLLLKLNDDDDDDDDLTVFIRN